ncbi:hypothetical protein PJI16_03780 [Nitrospira sp. MA-1]|nr:hypothetical protein [Nitrospira sp. MA-1]
MALHTKTAYLLVPIALIVSFLLCGVAGAYCPMSSSGTASHSSQPASPLTPSDHHRVCPDQLSSATEQLKVLTVVALPATHIHILDLFTHGSSQNFMFARATHFSSYPLLFLRFSALLN